MDALALLMSDANRFVETANRDTPGPQPGEAAPDFTVQSLDGQVITLSGLRGRVVLLDFWATWCGPCMEEMPNVKEVWEQYGQRKDFALFGLSLDDEKAKLEQFLKEKQIGWPQAFLDGWYSSEAVARYRVTGIPHTVLIDREGKIVATGLRGFDIADAVAGALGR